MSFRLSLAAVMSLHVLANAQDAGVITPVEQSETQIPQSESESLPAAAQREAPILETVVREKSHPAEPKGSGDLQIDVGKLSAVPRRTAAKLLTLAPGVMLANHGGEGHAPTVFLRGFDAGEGKDIEFRLEGVPLNDVSNAHGHGYADTFFIIPELVRSLRVTEGLLSGSQGDFAVAGTVNYELGISEPGVQLRGEMGNYGERRVFAAWRFNPESEADFVGAQFRQGAGFGPGRAHASGSVMAQTEVQLSPDTRLRLLGAASASRFGSAGVIRLDDLQERALPCDEDERSQFFCSYDLAQGGAQQRHLISAELRRRFGNSRFIQQAFFVYRQMRIRENFTGFVNDVPPPGEEQRGDRTELSYGGTTAGLRGRLTTRRGGGFRHELGYDVRSDSVQTGSYRLRARGGAPYRTLFQNDVKVTNLGAFADAEWQPLSWLALRGALRLDSFFFAVEDQNRPTVDRQGEREAEERVDAYGLAPSVRGSAEVKLAPDVYLLAGGGMGARSSDAAALSEAEFAPFARVVSVEVGPRWKPESHAVQAELRGAAFGTHVQRDLLFDAAAGRNEPIGATRRLGLFGLGRVRGSFFDVQGSLAYSRANMQDPTQASWPLLGGSALPYVPSWLGRVDAAFFWEASLWSDTLKWGAAAGTSYYGPRPLPLGQASNSIFLLDLNAHVSWRKVELSFSVENVTDTLWREAEFNFVSSFRDPNAVAPRMAMRHFSAGAPRMFRLALGYRFDL